jgi:hypothetical protein
MSETGRIKVVFISGICIYLLAIAVLARVISVESTPLPELRIERASWHRTVSGSPPTILLAGKGLDRGTRFSLFPDFGNRDHIIASVRTFGPVQQVAFCGDKAYLAANYRGLLVVDMSDPARPAIIGSVKTPGKAMDLAVAGDRVYVAAALGGVQIVNINDP